MREGYFEREKTLQEVINFLKQVMPDVDPWVEKKDDKLIIAGAMAFIHNIKSKRFEAITKLEKSPYFKNIRFETGGHLVIEGDFVTPIEGVDKFEFRVDKDM